MTAIIRTTCFWTMIRIGVNARLTFTPNGGTPASTTAKLKCKLPRKHRKR